MSCCDKCCDCREIRDLRSRLKEAERMNKVWIRRTERDCFMLDELFSMLPIATQERLTKERWVLNTIKEWDCDRC